MKKIEFTNVALHQGDVQMFGVRDIPAWAKKIENRFLAESEQSGSMHALMGVYDMYECEEGVFIDAKEECILNHSLKEHLKDIPLNVAIELPKKDHRFSVIKPGKYFVGIQQRFDPLTAMKQKVKD